MPSAAEIRDGQRTAWAGLSASWEKWDSVIMAQLAPVGAAIIAGLDLTDGRRHLEIAAGTGEPGLTIAKLVPRGRVVLTDLTPEMLAVAARRAVAQGIANVETAVCSADDLPFADASFDSVSVRFGYMFFPDLAAATAEFARVLAPGGRLCASVWISPEQNPWTTLAMRAVGTEVAVPPPDPDAPSMFRCAAAGCIGDLYAAAGLREIAEWEVGVELVTRSPQEYWQLISEHVSIIAGALGRVDAAALERIRALVLAGAGEYLRDGLLRLPGRARCIAGTKPGG